MRKSIKKMVGYRVAAALLSVVLFSVVTTVNIMRIKRAEAENAQAFALLNRAQTAEAAHYKWSSGLSNALYAGKEFTGSIDPTTCVLGKWLYGEAGTDNARILSLRTQMEPIHKELHESAVQVLETLKTNPTRAQSYYQETIQSNLTTLVGMLEQVVEEGAAISEKSMATVESITLLMNILCLICLVVALACLLSLVQYVLRRVVRPILEITRNTAPLQEGRLDLEMGQYGQNELGDLASTLERSMAQVHTYVRDLNAVMDQLSQGNFDVQTAVPYIGDFKSIEDSLNSRFGQDQPGPGPGFQQRRSALQRCPGAGAGSDGAGQRCAGAVRHSGRSEQKRGSECKNCRLRPGECPPDWGTGHRLQPADGADGIRHGRYH